MSIALSIAEAVEKRAAAEGAARVSSIELVVGKLSGIEPESLRFCFSAASKGTVAEDAELLIEVREGTARCMECAKEFPVSFYFAECPGCGSLRVSILSGEEFLIQSMTIEEEGD